MNKLLYLLFLSIFLLDYFAFHLEIISRQFNWLPEIISAFALVIVLLRAAAMKSFSMAPKYGFLSLMFVLVIFAGIVINTVPSGAIFSGIRTFFKYIPFFLLPAVYDFSDKEVNNQFRFLFAASVLQLPVALWQRFVQFKGVLTGDVVTGTIAESGVLSVYLISALAMLVAFYLKKRIKGYVFAMGILLLFIPTTINESKATLFLLPLALLAPAFYMPGAKSKFIRLGSIFAVVVLLIAIFIPIYDHFVKPRWGYGIVEFFTMEDRAARYLAPRTSQYKPESVGRVDAIIVPFEKLSADPVQLLVGLGIGNVSISALKGFSGEYVEYDKFVKSGTSYLLWETGVLGTLSFLLFFYFVFSDARWLRTRQEIFGAVALGWLGVLMVLGLSLFYINIFRVNPIIYPFFYISGYIAAKRWRLTYGVAETANRTNENRQESALNE